MGSVYAERGDNRNFWFANVEVIFSMFITLTKDKAAMGGTYGFTKAAAANLRERDDSWNPAIGGFLSGGVLGLRC